MRKFKDSGQFFTLASRLLRCCLVVIVTRPTGHNTAETNYTVKSVSPVLSMGYSPVWISETKSVYFVDENDFTIYRYQPDTEEFVGVFVDKHDLLKILVPVSGQPATTFVVDNFEKLSVLTWNGKHAELINDAYDLSMNLSGTDESVVCAKGDINGRLWVGVTHDTNEPRQGKLLMLDENGNFIKKIDNIYAPDSIAWSPNGNQIYWLNKDVRSIYAHSFDREKGEINGDGLLVFDFGVEKLSGLPSDMTMDTDGNLWVSCMNTSYVLKIDPLTSTKLLDVAIPGGASLTGVTFGGEKLEDLYVTGLSTNVFRVIDTGSKGFIANAVKLPPH